MRLVSIPFIREITQKEIEETTRAEIIFRRWASLDHFYRIYLFLFVFTLFSVDHAILIDSLT